MAAADAHQAGRVRLLDGGALGFEIHGSEHAGLPRLLLRPLGGSIALWGEFRAQLSRALRVISFDYRGVGCSSPAQRFVSVGDLARDALWLLDELGVARAHAIGISLGGMVALRAAADAPLRIAKLCVASTPASGIELTRTGLRRGLQLAACFARPRAQVEPAITVGLLSREFRRTHRAAVERIAATVSAQPTARAVLAKHALAGLMFASRRALRRIEAPALVLQGDRDALADGWPARELARVLPHARFESTAGAGHALTLEQPLLAGTRVLAFLSS